jgi:hypothetical protein
MIITEEVKKTVEGSAFLSLVTLNPDGTPHPIIAGKGNVSGDSVIFGIYKMDTTQKNLAKNKNAWVVAATMDGGPKGFRLSGTATPKDKEVVFAASKVEALI